MWWALRDQLLSKKGVAIIWLVPCHCTKTRNKMRLSAHISIILRNRRKNCSINVFTKEFFVVCFFWLWQLLYSVEQLFKSFNFFLDFHLLDSEAWSNGGTSCKFHFNHVFSFEGRGLTCLLATPFFWQNHQEGWSFVAE